MPATSTTMAGSYKQVYGKTLVDALGNLSTDLWDKLQVSSDKPRGQGFYFPVHVAANLSGGPTGELAPLREAQSEVNVQAHFSVKEYEWSVEISNLAVKLGEGNQAAFVQAIDQSFTSKLDTARNMLGNDLYRDGTGTLSLVNGAVSASTTVVVDDATPFREQMMLDGYDSTNTTRQMDSVQVKAVNPFTNTLTMASAVTLDDNAVLRIEDVQTSGAFSPIQGLKKIVDTTNVAVNYLNLSRNTYLKWRGNYYDAGGVAVSADLLQQMLDRVRTICGMEPPNIISNQSQRRKYLQLAVPQRRFMNGTFDLGHDTMEFNGKAWTIDTKCQRDTIWMLELSDIKKYQLGGLDLNEDGGGGALKPVPGYRKRLAYYEYTGEVAAMNPYRHLQLTNLAVPSI